MTRLIDAEKLKQALKSNCKPDLCHDINTAWCERCCRTNDFEDLIDEAPTVEEEGRPHGEWEIVDAEGGKIWNCVCSECGHDPQEYIGGIEDWWLRKPLPNYCPNCGADMREGDK